MTEPCSHATYSSLKCWHGEVKSSHEHDITSWNKRQKIVRTKHCHLPLFQQLCTISVAYNYHWPRSNWFFSSVGNNARKWKSKEKLSAQTEKKEQVFHI